MQLICLPLLMKVRTNRNRVCDYEPKDHAAELVKRPELERTKLSHDIGCCYFTGPWFSNVLCLYVGKKGISQVICASTAAA